MTTAEIIAVFCGALVPIFGALVWLIWQSSRVVSKLDTLTDNHSEHKNKINQVTEHLHAVDKRVGVLEESRKNASWH